MASHAESTNRPGTVAVVGAGPAGVAAAVQTASAGLSTTLIDAAARFGGQFWRHGVEDLDADLHHHIRVYRSLATRAEQLIRTGQLRHLPHHHVWTLNSGVEGCTVHAIDGRNPTVPAETTVTADYLILAVGAFDRQVPFPGWDLPGVMAVGAAQSLLKSSGVVVGPRVLIAGTGPFLLPTAAGLARRGADVVGVYEANRPSRWLRHHPPLVMLPGKLVEATGYAATLARHRVPVRNRSVVIAAHGTNQLEAVTVARLDRTGAIRPECQRHIPIDVLAIGYGFTVQSELPMLAGCAMRTTADQTLAVRTDNEQATDIPRVYAAGETTGVGGAQLAVVEGNIAGIAVARAAGADVFGSGQRQICSLVAMRGRLRRFAAAMHAVYPVPPVWMDTITPGTIVCRCEEVTVADVDSAVDLGARDTRTVKLLSRAGMGWCQGRECAYAIACLTARRTGGQLEMASTAARPVASPIPLGLVAGTPTPPR